MRILVISQYWYPENGVPQRRWQWLTKILKSQGHEVDVIAPPPTYPTGRLDPHWEETQVEIGPAGERIYRTPLIPHSHSLISRATAQARIALSTLFAALRSYKAAHGRPDLIIATIPAIPCAPIAMVLSVVFRKPYIVDLRDAWPELLDDFADWNSAVASKSQSKSIVKKLLVSGVLKAVTTAINISLARADQIFVTAETLMIPGKEAVVIRNVFPTADWDLSDTQSPEAKENGSLHILYAGTVGRAQQLLNAVKAFEILQEDFPRAEMRIVGGGISRKHLKKYAETHDLKIEFIKRVPHSQMQMHYEWADTALVHLADWKALHKTVPSKTYELMENGIHITGVVQGETAEMIKSLGAGNVVPPNNPELLAYLWKLLAENGSELSKNKVPQRWVKNERDFVTPNRLRAALKRYGH